MATQKKKKGSRLGRAVAIAGGVTGAAAAGAVGYGAVKGVKEGYKRGIAAEKIAKRNESSYSREEAKADRQARAGATRRAKEAEASAKKSKISAEKAKMMETRRKVGYEKQGRSLAGKAHTARNREARALGITGADLQKKAEQTRTSNKILAAARENTKQEAAKKAKKGIFSKAKSAVSGTFKELSEKGRAFGRMVGKSKVGQAVGKGVAAVGRKLATRGGKIGLGIAAGAALAGGAIALARRGKGKVASQKQKALLSKQEVSRRISEGMKKSSKVKGRKRR